jgi:hypothetical protein
MPRWVKAATAVVLVLVVVLMIGKLAGVEHGPSMHGGGGETPATRVTDDGASPPAGSEGHSPPAGAESHTPPAGAEGHTPPAGVDHEQP